MLGYNCLKQQRISCGDYAIVPVQKEHIELIRQWRNQQMDVLRQTDKIGKSQQVEYFSRKIWSQFNKEKPADILMGFLYKDHLIGYGGLVNVAWEHRRAEISFLLATERIDDLKLYRNNFSAYLKLTKRLASEQLFLNRLFTETYHFRKHHISVLEDAGFVSEGVMRQHTFVDGVPIDSIIHGFLVT